MNDNQHKDFNPVSALQLGLILPFLTLFLVVLKLKEVIDWSWWLVLSPIAFHAIGIFFFLLAIGLFSVAGLFYMTSIAIKYLVSRLRGKEQNNV